MDAHNELEIRTSRARLKTVSSEGRPAVRKMTDGSDRLDIRVNCSDCERTIMLSAERLRTVPTVRCPGCGRDLTSRAQETARHLSRKRDT